MTPYCKLIPGTKTVHYVLYAMNKYRGTFDVLDSLEWAKGYKSSFHLQDIKEIVRVFLFSDFIAYIQFFVMLCIAKPIISFTQFYMSQTGQEDGSINESIIHTREV